MVSKKQTENNKKLVSGGGIWVAGKLLTFIFSA